jgi:hypothetical protein
MSDLFPSFFESRKPASPPAKVANRAKVFATASRTLAPLATLAGAEGQIGGGTPQTLARLATLAGVDGQIGAEARGPNIQPAAPGLAPHQEVVSPDCETWRARAASLEHDAGLPHEWAEPFAKLLCGGPPRGFDPDYWEHSVKGASIFARQWAAQALALGWTAGEVFGLDDIAPGRRHDKKGLAWLLPDGKHVVALDAGGADIETARGVKQRFFAVPGAGRRSAT